jgi:excisionase family DNA binding protein
MDEQNDIKNGAVRELEILNKQVSEIIQFQRKTVSGYDYINANELADLLGESIKTVYARVYNRQIPFYKPGGKLLLFKLTEIEEWIKTGRHSSVDELRHEM